MVGFEGGEDELVVGLVVLQWLVLWCMCVIARVGEDQARVKNMMCSGLWGGGGVVSDDSNRQ